MIRHVVVNVDDDYVGGDNLQILFQSFFDVHYF
jgi:hypothetical protein